jgi:hypothetical protein
LKHLIIAGRIQKLFFSTRAILAIAWLIRSIFFEQEWLWNLIWEFDDD